MLQHYTSVGVVFCYAYSMFTTCTAMHLGSNNWGSIVLDSEILRKQDATSRDRRHILYTHTHTHDWGDQMSEKEHLQSRPLNRSNNCIQRKTDRCKEQISSVHWENKELLTEPLAQMLTRWEVIMLHPLAHWLIAPLPVYYAELHHVLSWNTPSHTHSSSYSVRQRECCSMLT